ncbi:MAG: FmdB family zinc ribbon protein [Bradymonadia bacterium]|jgi:putative FmdB family regulatory protein
MPIYEYGCEQCGHVLEEWAKLDDPPPSKCPKCGTPNPKKLISKTAFHLKGGGWYAQGYGAGGGAPKPAEGATSTTDTASTTPATPAAPAAAPATPAATPTPSSTPSSTPSTSST